jgi:hypothetical protein
MPTDGVPVPLFVGPWHMAHVLGRLVCDEGGVPWHDLQLGTAVARVQVGVGVGVGVGLSQIFGLWQALAQVPVEGL